MLHVATTQWGAAVLGDEYDIYFITVEGHAE